MIYLISIVFGVFLIFWLGDFYLTRKTIKHLGNKVELNPIIRFISRGRGKLIYLFKPLELGIFIYLLWSLIKFEGAVPFYILLFFIFFYSLLVINNAHVYYKVTKKESIAFKIIFLGLMMAMLLFIYLNYLLYLDLNISYNSLSKSNQNYNQLYTQCQGDNISAPEPRNIRDIIPELNLPIRRSGLE